MGGSRCSRDDGFNRAAWTTKEDAILRDYINIHGVKGGWRSIRHKTGLNRSGKSCRLRWMNYLRPNIKRGNISTDEDDLIIRLHRLLGNRWSLIAGRLPGRTGNEIKNYWNTYLSKKIATLNKRDRMEDKMTEEDIDFSTCVDPVAANQIAVSFNEESRTLLNEDSTMEMCSRHHHNINSLILENEELIFEHNEITSQGVLDLDCSVQFPLSPISSYIDFQMSYLFSSAGHA